VNVLISNPPYIPLKEKEKMDKNVTLHEPHEALFVEDDDPLLFYKAIADIALHRLTKKGSLYVETHEKLAKQTAAVFAERKFQTIAIRKDMQGRERMIKAALY
jgi:release factor glutamine methyltransferase